MLELIQEHEVFIFLEPKKIQQFSSGIKVSVQYDAYKDSVIVWRYSTESNMQNSRTLEYDHATNTITLPYDMFKALNAEKKAYMQCKSVKDGEVSQSNVIKIGVKESLDDGDVIDPNDPDDVQFIISIIDQQFILKVIPAIKKQMDDKFIVVSKEGVELPANLSFLVTDTIVLPFNDSIRISPNMAIKPIK